jgi:hypothetical protein
MSLASASSQATESFATMESLMPLSAFIGLLSAFIGVTRLTRRLRRL